MFVIVRFVSSEVMFHHVGALDRLLASQVDLRPTEYTCSNLRILFEVTSF